MYCLPAEAVFTSRRMHPPSGKAQRSPNGIFIPHPADYLAPVLNTSDRQSNRSAALQPSGNRNRCARLVWKERCLAARAKRGYIAKTVVPQHAIGLRLTSPFCSASPDLPARPMRLQFLISPANHRLNPPRPARKEGASRSSTNVGSEHGMDGICAHDECVERGRFSRVGLRSRARSAVIDIQSPPFSIAYLSPETAKSPALQ